MTRPLLTTLAPVPRRRRWGRDAFGAVLAAVLFASLFVGCQSAPDRRVQAVPAWTNAAPYEGAKAPSWGNP